MTATEMRNEFEILYNNITSNQAPALDDYEISIFLTRGERDILKSYFDPVLNRAGRGYDGNTRRQIDFSNLTTVANYIIKSADGTGNDSDEGYSREGVEFENKDAQATEKQDTLDRRYEIKNNGDDTKESKYDDKTFFVDEGFLADGSVRVTLPNDIYSIVNERVIVARDVYGKEKQLLRKPLVVVPITSKQWDSMSNLSYKRPLKNQAWRLMSNSSSSNSNAELIYAPNDIFVEYIIRYVRTPKPIIVTDLSEDELTIEGLSEVTDCELDASIHGDIVQRAAELAKAAYIGDVSTFTGISVASQTEVGRDQSPRSYNPYNPYQ